MLQSDITKTALQMYGNVNLKVEARTRLVIERHNLGIWILASW